MSFLLQGDLIQEKYSEMRKRAKYDMLKIRPKIFHNKLAVLKSAPKIWLERKIDSCKVRGNVLFCCLSCNYVAEAKGGMSERVYYRKTTGKWEARYVKGKNAAGKTLYGSVFGDSREEAIARREALIGKDPNNPLSIAEMDILILGAGSYGREVKDVLEKIRVFHRIDFLDDNIRGEDIIGKCADAQAFRDRYPCAFVAIGNNDIRRRYGQMLIENRFLVPTIISPDAVVSPKAVIGMGSMIFSSGNVGSDTVIGEYAMVQAGGVVQAKAVVGAYSRIDSGAIVAERAVVPEGLWLRYGEYYESEGKV